MAGRRVRVVWAIIAASVVCAKGAAAAQVTPVAALLAPEWRPAAVTLSEGMSPESVTACVVAPGVAALRPSPTTTGAFEAQCALTGVMQCAVPGAEPRDLDMAAVCNGVEVALVSAPRRLVATRVPGPGASAAPATIEWRTWREVASEPLAARAVDLALGPLVPVAMQPRLMRVLRPGVSPVTIVVPAGDPSADPAVPMVLPEPRPGGELLLMLGTRERLTRTITMMGPETRVVETHGQTFLSVPGLTPGEYTLRFNVSAATSAPDARVVIRAESTTEFMPQFAGADAPRISGVVTYNGRPLAGQSLDVVRLSDDATVTVSTGADGRYAVAVPVAGEYLVRVAWTFDFGFAEAVGQVDQGETTLNIDVAGSAVRLTFLVNGAAPNGPVEFVLQGAERFSGIARLFDAPTELLAMPPGRYVVRANMAPDLVSDAVTLEIRDTPDVHALTLNLTTQTATLKVVDASGSPVEGARALAGTRVLRARELGEIDISRMSPGVELVIFAPGLIPACVVLQPKVDQVVALVGENAPLQIWFDFERLRVPPGRIRFKETDACAVPLEEFDWVRIAAGFEIRNLPKDTPVMFEYGDRRIPLKAPGPGVIIR